MKAMMRWTMNGIFEDGFETTVFGMTSKECIYALMDNYEDEHGELVRYFGFNGKEYVEGEAV